MTTTPEHPIFWAGDRVRHKDQNWPGEHHRTTATVRYVGTYFLAVQIDGLPYEDVWTIDQAERLRADPQDDRCQCPSCADPFTYGGVIEADT